MALKLVGSTFFLGWKDFLVNDLLPKEPSRELGKAEKRWESPAEESVPLKREKEIYQHLKTRAF